MIGLLLAIVLACVTYWLVSVLTHVFILAVLAAVLVLLCGVGYGWHSRRGVP